MATLESTNYVRKDKLVAMQREFSTPGEAIAFGATYARKLDKRKVALWKVTYGRSFYRTPSGRRFIRYVVVVRPRPDWEKRAEYSGYGC